MIPASTHARRRKALIDALDGAAVLLVGTQAPLRTSPINPYPHRQDSNFLYFTGCSQPGAAALIDQDGCTLFLQPPADDDELWHGHVDSLEDLRLRYGVERTAAIDTLEDACRDRRLLSVAVADPHASRKAAALVGRELVYGGDNGEQALVEAVIRLRRFKDADELVELRRAAAATAAAFELAMSATHPGGNEAHVAALFNAALAARGCTNGYGSIVTVRGEVLHNPDWVNPLQAGQLLLLDGGGELLDSGYGVDITRTWPVDGRFTGRQRAAYQAVLEAEEQAIAMCRPGVRYRDVHLRAASVLARWLLDEGLLRGSLDAVMESHAAAVFFPHGVGHLLGLDTHDLEQFWDLAGYAPGRSRDPHFGTAYLRMDLDLEPGFVFTIEPGFYVVPAILKNQALRDRLGDLVDWDKAAGWSDFGGIRIEDDVLCTESGREVLTSATPKSIQAVEALVGSGRSAWERLTV
jgi:Xaa-Pro aminopeptidase